jgi:biopolymer transport protein ExbB
MQSIATDTVTQIHPPARAASHRSRSFLGRLFAVCLALCGAGYPAVSRAWWNDDWNFRKEITFDLSATGAGISESASDVPVLLRLHAGNFGYFADMKPDGSDLRVVAGDDKTPLQFHIERLDPTNQIAFVWVRLPQLAGGTTDAKIYLYYGNPKAESGASASSSYDASQAAVFHFSETSGLPLDSTANGNKVVSGSAQPGAASLIGGGLQLAAGGSLTVPSSSSLRLVPARGITFSAWVRGAAQPDAYVVALEDGAKAVTLGLDGAAASAQLLGAGAPVKLRSGDLAADQWHHLAVTVSGSRMVLYVDGAEAGAANVAAVEIAGTLTIGASAAGGHAFSGDIDELGVANVARPASLLQMAARSQGIEAPLVLYGADAQRESGGVSYFAITMKNVTPDGWVVIAILTVMLVIALLVIVGKAVALARVSGGNRAFLTEYYKLRDDPTALDVADGAKRPFGTSPLFDLYHDGVRELNRRHNGAPPQQGGLQKLSAQSIEAIHATLDANLVRQTQKMQSNMVLLTIAIAGGPFLGLLGTVVGVMITFAAIAASGDVNVNAIAPGIAAALVATVAGLAVAIPALFGYNWLNTKIKGIVADMRVFVDEFVTRIAEKHS